VGPEVIEYGGKRFAEIIRKDVQTDTTKFFSPAESSLQFGLLAHKAGFTEKPHFHKPIKRLIDDLQQMFVVQKGKVLVQFFADSGDLLGEATLEEGDSILLIQGAHAIKAIEDMQCLSVKQGPFLGNENDKAEI